MKKLILFNCILLGLFFSSCTDDVETTSPNQNTNEGLANDGIKVKDGYLEFSSNEVFQDFITQLDNESDGNYMVGTRSLSAKSRLSIDGFKPLARLKSEISSTTRSMGSADGSDQDEEMNQDEFNIMTAENLLLDPILTEVMDTTLRIGIADRIYKITQYGTFSAPTDKSSYIAEAIKNFDTNILNRSDLGDYISLGNDVTFTNSFGNEKVGNELVNNMDEVETIENEFDDEDAGTVRTRALAVSTYENNLHNGYNVSTFNWKNNSVWQKFWDWIRGKDVSKEVNFDSKHRVQVNVYNVNYGFYASSGIKVKMQKRKKFVFVKYWVGTSADKMAVGFNKLYGDMTYTNPRSFSSITPTAGTSWNQFTGSLNKLTSKFVYAQYK